MEKKTLLDALSSPADGVSVKRTKTGRLRELLPEIEAAQAAGYSNEDIAKSLTSRGLEIDKKTLETMLYRIRMEAKKPKNLKQPINTYKNQVVQADTSNSAKPNNHQPGDTASTVKSRRPSIDLGDY